MNSRHVFFVRRMKWTAIALAALPARYALADNWLNTGGGNWSSGANWSTSSPAAAGVAAAQFSLGASSPYTVTLDSISPLSLPQTTVQNDQVVIDFETKSLNDGQSNNSPISITSISGQTSSLNLSNGTLADVWPVTVGGSGGSSAFALNSFTLNFITEGGTLTFNPASTNSYTQTNSTFNDYFGAGFNLSNANATISGGGMMTLTGIYFGGKTSLSSTQLQAQHNDITFEANANITSSTVLSQSYLVIGGLDGQPFAAQPLPLVIPATGGGNAIVNVVNSNISSGLGTIIGTAGGTGILNASGGTTSIGFSPFATTFMVGIFGNGKVNITGGAQLDVGPASIGFNGGTGSVTISGTGSHWQTFGSDTTLGNGLIQLDNNATWTDILSIAHSAPTTGGNVNLSGGATLNVLSGARGHFTTLNEVNGSTLDIGLDAASNSVNGQLNIDSVATFAGILDVTLENGFQPTVGESFQLFTFGSETGAFSTLNLPANDSWDTSKLYSQGIISVTAVPEPGCAALVFLLAGATLGRRRSIRGLIAI